MQAQKKKKKNCTQIKELNTQKKALPGTNKH